MAQVRLEERTGAPTTALGMRGEAPGDAGTRAAPGVAVPGRKGLDITVRTGAGEGRTLLSAFDSALQGAGVADFNLITLSSVIPAASRIRMVQGPLAGEHGDVLFCVRAEAYAEHPGDHAWAGIGWCTDDSGAGLFVEHHGGSEEQVVEQIELSLGDMKAKRPGAYGTVHMALSSAHYEDQPACAVVVAAYRVSSWFDPTTPALPPAEPVQVVHAERAPEPTRPSATVTVEKEVDFATAREFYALYHETFGALETKAAARQLLTESEFMEEMLDRRIDKYIVWDDAGEAIAMGTVTDDLEAVPWLSPDFFRERYPDHWARGAVCYLGFSLAKPGERTTRAWHAMITKIVERMVENQAIGAWDTCLFNDQELRLAANAARLMSRLSSVDIQVVDQQTYYAGEFLPRA